MFLMVYSKQAHHTDVCWPLLIKFKLLAVHKQSLQNAVTPKCHATDYLSCALQSELLSVIAEKNTAAERAPPHRRHAREHNNTDGPQEAEVRRVRQRRE